jgi:hypothetical protein
VVAIEVILPDSGRVEITDTVRPTARALNGVGDSIAAQVYWSAFDSGVIAVLDSTTGVSLAKAVGSGLLQARVGALRSNPQTVVILTRLDALNSAGPTRVTLSLADSLSDSLRVVASATPVAPANRRVVFAATIFPDSGRAVTFVPNDSVLTSATGVAVTRLRLLAGLIPDSVIVTATMRRPDGTAIPGSPVTFVVEFP